MPAGLFGAGRWVVCVLGCCFVNYPGGEEVGIQETIAFPFLFYF